MPFTLPNPKQRNPLVFPDGTHDPATVFRNQVIDHPNIEIGDWTYYNDRGLPEGYAAKIIRMRFTEKDIETLLNLRWWDWPKEAIEEALPALETGDVASLVASAPNAG